MPRRSDLQGRLIAAWSCLLGRPVIFRINAQLTVTDEDIHNTPGTVIVVESHLRLTAPPRTLAELSDHEQWVAPEDGVIYDDGHGNITHDRHHEPE